MIDLRAADSQRGSEELVCELIDLELPVGAMFVQGCYGTKPVSLANHSRLVGFPLWVLQLVNILWA